jgi:hypothetical protein
MRNEENCYDSGDAAMCAQIRANRRTCGLAVSAHMAGSDPASLNRLRRSATSRTTKNKRRTHSLGCIAKYQEDHVARTSGGCAPLTTSF